MSARLDHIRVRDCMHAGIYSCPQEAPLGEVAGLMAKHRVHAVAVADGNGHRPVGIVSDLDVVAAAVTGDEPAAGAVAATEPLSVSANEGLYRAAQMMAEHEVTHLIVLDSSNGHPVGVISALDIAAVYAG